MRFRRPEPELSTQDMRIVLQLSEDEFMVLWQKRWLRGTGRAWPGVQVARLATLLDGLRTGKLLKPDVPMNLPKARRPRR